MMRLRLEACDIQTARPYAIGLNRNWTDKNGRGKKGGESNKEPQGCRESGEGLNGMFFEARRRT